MNTLQNWQTHEISNQFDELQAYNLFETDQVLQEILQRYGSTDQQNLSQLAQIVGSTEYYQYADLANRHTLNYMLLMLVVVVKIS
jgi:putative acyl-CoA dehydrogenase